MDDLISRQAALDAIDKNRQDLLSLGMDGAEHILVHYGRRVIEELPTAEKVGKWTETSSGDHWKCSRCNCRAGFWFNEENSCEWSMDMSEWLSDFCPNCGARMRGEEDECMR